MARLVAAPGPPWKDHRQVADGVLWRTRTGSPVMRAHHDDAGTCHEPPRDVHPALLATVLADDLPPRWRQSTLGTVSAVAPVTGARSNDTNPQAGQGKPHDRPGDREALGRSRGCLSAKIHLLADTRCRPLAVVTTAASAMTRSPSSSPWTTVAVS